MGFVELIVTVCALSLPRRASERVMAGIEKLLAKRLKLKMNKAKRIT